MLFISLTVIFYGFIALITLFTVYFVIIPYLKLLSFKKQGYATYFFPLLGTFRKYQLDFRNTGDCSTTTKESWKTSADEFYYTSIGGDVALVLRGPKYLRQFLLNQHLYKKSKFTSALSVMGNGLVTSEGDVWKRHRKIISSMFNYDFLKMNTKIIQDTVKEFIDNIRPSEYDNYSVLNRIQDITAEVVGRIFFGENLTQYNYEGKPLTIFLGEIMIEFSICSRTPLVILFGPKVFHFSWISQYKKLMQKVTSFRAICLKIINDRKAHPQKNNDLLGLLLSTQKAEDPEQRFSDDDIIDEFITFFVAGMDTTGHTTCMALYNLAQNPKYLDEIKQERDQTYNTEKVATADTLQKMNVLHSVVKETLRLHTPSPGFAPREALVDHKLSDLTIKKGQLIFFELLASFYSEKYYDKPYEFNPERWKTEPKDDSYAFVPFSGGARNCIGQHLALMESKIIISEFCEKFDFKVKDGYKLRMIIRLAYEPYDELTFKLSPKKNK